MGKLIKGCLTAALILILAGVGLYFAASFVWGADQVKDFLNKASGGRLEQWQKILESHVQQGEEFLENPPWQNGDGYEIEDSTIFDPDRTVLQSDVDQTFAGEDILSLKVNAGGCEFRIEKSSDADFHIQSENVGKIQVYQEKGTLVIRTVRKTDADVSQCRILLQVPEGSFEEADIEVGAGSLALNSLTAEYIDLETGAGQITADEISAEGLSLSVGAGSILIDSMNVADLDARVGAGRFAANGTAAESVNAECSVGSIELHLKGTAADYDYELKCMAGSIHLDGEQYSGLANEKKISNNAARTMKLECSVGEIRVEFE